jgi:hypothetical protein
MSDVNDLINALKSGDMSTSNVTFASLMQDKMNAVMDARKVQLAQTMVGVSPETEAEEEETEDDEVQELPAESD